MFLEVKIGGPGLVAPAPNSPLITKPVWSDVLALSARTLKKTLLVLLLVSFAITLNQRRTFLLHINTLACVKAEIQPMFRNLQCSYIV